MTTPRTAEEIAGEVWVKYWCPQCDHGDSGATCSCTSAPDSEAQTIEAIAQAQAEAKRYWLEQAAGVCDAALHRQTAVEIRALKDSP